METDVNPPSLSKTMSGRNNIGQRDSIDRATIRLRGWHSDLVPAVFSADVFR